MNDAAIEQIIDRLADESRRRRNSAVVWFLLGAIFQAGIILLLYKARSFARADVADKLKFFFVVSPFVVWVPIAVSFYYFRRWRTSLMRPENSLFRALTSEPQLITAIEREPDAEILKPQTTAERKPADDRAGDVAGAVFEGVLDVALSAAFGAASDGNSNDDYNTNSTDASPNAPRAPRVFVRLTNGETHEISTPLDAAQTVAALQKHAPRAVVAETKK